MYRNHAGFGSGMARTTKADQVGQFIGLLVIVIGVGYVAEVAERPNMVNIQFVPFLLLGLAAILASIAITLSGFPLLSSPIRAVVIGCTALPQFRVRAALAGRLPVGAALRVAEVMRSLGCADSGRVTFQRLSAEIARLADRLRPVWIVGPGHCAVFNFPICKAGFATEVAFVATKLTGACSPNCFAALFTGDNSIAGPARVVLPCLVLAHPLPFATGVAEVVLRSLDPIRMALQCRATSSAKNFYLFGLPLIVALAATEVILGGRHLGRPAVQRRAAVVALYFHRCFRNRTPRRDAQKCDLKSYAGVFGFEYIANALSGNSSLGRMSILPRIAIGGQS